MSLQAQLVWNPYRVCSCHPIAWLILDFAVVERKSERLVKGRGFFYNAKIISWTHSYHQPHKHSSYFIAIVEFPKVFLSWYNIQNVNWMVVCNFAKIFLIKGLIVHTVLRYFLALLIRLSGQNPISKMHTPYNCGNHDRYYMIR